jgi:hypothetical protein
MFLLARRLYLCAVSRYFRQAAVNWFDPGVEVEHLPDIEAGPGN